MTVTTYRKVGQTKFKKDEVSGVLVLDDNGRIAASVDMQSLFDGLKLDSDVTKNNPSYIGISKPSKNDMKTVMDRLFDM